MKNIVVGTLFLIFILVIIGVFLIFSLGSPVLLGKVSSETRLILSLQIIDFQSPAKLGEFLEFSYSTKDILGVNGTAEINFLLEKNGEIISYGSDIIYLGGFEERIRITKIFLPTSIESGIYNLKIEADYQGYTIKAHRTIEIKVKGGLATINPGHGELNIFIIIALVILMIFNIYMVYRIERKEIKNLILEEERFIKRHKVSILILSFFVILGILIYYLNLINILSGIPLYLYYLALGILLLLALFLNIRKKKRSFRKN